MKYLVKTICVVTRSSQFAIKTKVLRHFFHTRRHRDLIANWVRLCSFPPSRIHHLFCFIFSISELKNLGTFDQIHCEKPHVLLTSYQIPGRYQGFSTVSVVCRIQVGRVLCWFLVVQHQYNPYLQPHRRWTSGGAWIGCQIGLASPTLDVRWGHGWAWV